MDLREMPEFAKLITAIGIFYDKPMNEFMLDIYWRCLNAYGFSVIREACNTHLKDPDQGRFMPKPADLIRHLRKADSAKAMAAWDQVNRAMRAVGGYKSVRFEDLLIHCVIADMGGWIRVCETDQRNYACRAAEFEQRYLRYLENPPQKWPLQLSGFIETHNAAKGYMLNNEDELDD